MSVDCEYKSTHIVCIGLDPSSSRVQVDKDWKSPQICLTPILLWSYMIFYFFFTLAPCNDAESSAQIDSLHMHTTLHLEQKYVLGVGSAVQIRFEILVCINRVWHHGLESGIWPFSPKLNGRLLKQHWACWNIEITIVCVCVSWQVSFHLLCYSFLLHHCKAHFHISSAEFADVKQPLIKFCFSFLTVWFGANFSADTHSQPQEWGQCSWSNFPWDLYTRFSFNLIHKQSKGKQLHQMMRWRNKMKSEQCSNVKMCLAMM